MFRPPSTFHYAKLAKTHELVIWVAPFLPIVAGLLHSFEFISKPHICAIAIQHVLLCAFYVSLVLFCGVGGALFKL